MADSAAIPSSLPRSPEPGRPSLKMTEAAHRLGVTRKVMQARLRRNPQMGWVDTSGERVRWYVYEDTLGTPGGDPAVIAELSAQVDQLSAELAEIQARNAATEIADLRARLVRAETANALLIEAFELEEEALKRFRQVLSLHTTPGHIGDLADPSPAGRSSANPAARQ